MEIGNVGSYTQSINNNLEQQNRVEAVQRTSRIEPAVENSRSINDTNSVELQNSLEQVRKSSQIQEQQKQAPIEYALSNTNFGFNSNSRDFFVKVERGDSVNQYPTDDMMKLKAYLLEE